MIPWCRRTLPADHSPDSSAEMRGQLTALKALIDALQSVTAAQVDGVATLDPGDAASVTLSVIGDTLHFSFGVPRGSDGGQGPPFTNFVMDGVSTLNPGDNATVQIVFDGSAVRLTFGIPRGATGGDGTQGKPRAARRSDRAAACRRHRDCAGRRRREFLGQQ